MRNNSKKTQNMKKIVIILVVGMLMVCLLPLAAQAEDNWKSTSSMQMSGSSYSSQVTSVGADETVDLAPMVHHPGSIRKSDFGENDQPEPGGSEQHDTENSPIGDGVLPLLLLSAMAGGVIFLRRRKLAQA